METPIGETAWVTRYSSPWHAPGGHVDRAEAKIDCDVRGQLFADLLKAWGPELLKSGSVSTAVLVVESAVKRWEERMAANGWSYAVDRMGSGAQAPDEIGALLAESEEKTSC